MTSQQIPPDAQDGPAPHRQDEGAGAGTNLAAGGKGGGLLLWPAIIMIVVAVAIILYFVFR